MIKNRGKIALGESLRIDCKQVVLNCLRDWQRDCHPCGRLVTH